MTEAAAGADRREERAWAALSHLGIPFFGPLLPYAVLHSAEDGSFRRQHARQALAFQLAYFILYVGTMIASFGFGVIPDTVLPVMIVVGLLLETPQIRLALLGEAPIQVTPRESSLA